jgi:hypothetical protein
LLLRVEFVKLCFQNYSLFLFSKKRNVLDFFANSMRSIGEQADVC